MSPMLESNQCFEPIPAKGVWIENGVFYAEITHPASEVPLRVALHGVLTPQQAREALALLATRSGPPFRH